MFGLEHTCDVWRNAGDGSNGRKLKQLLYSGVPVLFLPLVKPISIELKFNLGRDYNAYADPATDIQVGDQLKWSGKTLNVRTVSLFDVPGVGHLEVLATEDGI